MTAWLDENCGSDGWAMTRSGMRGVLNDAVALYFADAIADHDPRLVEPVNFVRVNGCAGST
jgi:hypothetical protein